MMSLGRHILGFVGFYLMLNRMSEKGLCSLFSLEVIFFVTVEIGVSAMIEQKSGDTGYTLAVLGVYAWLLEYMIKVKLMERMTTYVQYMCKKLTIIMHVNSIVEERLLKTIYCWIDFLFSSIYLCLFAALCTRLHYILRISN